MGSKVGSNNRSVCIANINNLLESVAAERGLARAYLINDLVDKFDFK